MKPLIELRDDDLSDILSEKRARQISLINKVITVVFIIIFSFLSFYGFMYMKRITDIDIKILFYIDGEKIGYIEDTDIIPKVINELIKDIYTSTGIIYNFNSKISYKIENNNNSVKYIGEEELYKTFMKRSSYNFINAYALYIGDKFVAACENENDIITVLQRLEKDETNRVRSLSIDSAVIFNKIMLREQIFLINDVIPPIQLYKKLNSFIDTDNIVRDEQALQTKNTVEVTCQITGLIPVQENEDLTDSDDIAALYTIPEITPETITYDIAAEAVMTGQADDSDNERVIIRSGGMSADLINYSIDFGIPRVYSNVRQKKESDDIALKFKYVKHETITETAERKTVYRYNKHLFKDFKKTLEDGKDGLKLSTYKLEFVGDELITRQIVSSQILEESTDRVLLLGTKDYPDAGVIVENHIWPMILLNEPVITSYFGERRPEFDGNSYHYGLDIQACVGTDVFASNGGVVSYVNRTNSYGIMVIIDHDDGIQTCYAHLSKALVEIGDKVFQGQRIALSGNTGVSTSPHLHFEVRVDSVPKEPYNYLLCEPWKFNQ